MHGADLETGSGVPDLEASIADPLQLHLYCAVCGHGHVSGAHLQPAATRQSDLQPKIFPVAFDHEFRKRCGFRHNYWADDRHTAETPRSRSLA